MGIESAVFKVKGDQRVNVRFQVGKTEERQDFVESVSEVIKDKKRNLRYKEAYITNCNEINNVSEDKVVYFVSPVRAVPKSIVLVDFTALIS